MWKYHHSHAIENIKLVFELLIFVWIPWLNKRETNTPLMALISDKNAMAYQSTNSLWVIEQRSRTQALHISWLRTNIFMFKFSSILASASIKILRKKKNSYQDIDSSVCLRMFDAKYRSSCQGVRNMWNVMTRPISEAKWFTETSEVILWKRSNRDLLNTAYMLPEGSPINQVRS